MAKKKAKKKRKQTKTKKVKAPTKSSRTKWKPYNKSVPAVLVGTEEYTDGKWYSITVKVGGKKGYISFQNRKDCDNLAASIVQLALQSEKGREEALKELEKVSKLLDRHEKKEAKRREKRAARRRSKI